MSKRIKIEVTTTNGDTYSNEPEEVTDEQIAKLREYLDDLDSIRNLDLTVAADRKVYFRTEHVVAVTLTVIEEDA